MASDSDRLAHSNKAIDSVQSTQKGTIDIRDTSNQLLGLRSASPTADVNSTGSLAYEKVTEAVHDSTNNKNATIAVGDMSSTSIVENGQDHEHSMIVEDEVNSPNIQITSSKAAKQAPISEEATSGDQSQLNVTEAHEPGVENTDGNWPKPEEKKGKKKKKSSGKNKKPNPTGFEDFYADPPITPSEYNEEYFDVYSNSRSFIERIEQCIQRYRAARKLDSVRANVFNKYITLGGIDTSMKAFTGGLDQDTIENFSAAEVARFQAQDYVRGSTSLKFYNPDNARHWVIDFEGIAKGFLSHRAPEAFGRDPPVIKQYCAVVRNFLNYVIYHGVCPEYTENIVAAQMICDRAEEELIAINKVGRIMPGDFNMAASTLYGGYYYNLYVDTSSWAQESNDDAINNFPRASKRLLTGMTVPEADRIFKTGIAFAGTYEMFKAMKGVPQVIKTERSSMEIVKITFPTLEKKRQYAGTKDLDGLIGNIKPLGLLAVRPWDNMQAENEDLTFEEEAAALALRKNRAKDGGPIEEFWLEEEVLQKCFIGMKFEATVRELDIGLKYFDSIIGIYPSFFTYLPADRLYGWKEPILSTRPAPSVENSMGIEDDVVDFD